MVKGGGNGGMCRCGHATKLVTDVTRKMFTIFDKQQWTGTLTARNYNNVVCG
jgi:hypothetical protein